MVDRPAPIAVPVRCPSCGQAKPGPVSPEVERWNNTAAGLFREARAAHRDGKPQVALVLRKRATSALTRAIEAQIESEVAGCAT